MDLPISRFDYFLIKHPPSDRKRNRGSRAILSLPRIMGEFYQNGR
jgi:hypothetical protein